MTTTPATAPAVASAAAPDPAVLAAALTPCLAALQALEAHLNTVFIERQAAIRAILVALLARQHAVLIGPPGTAKSDLIATLARRIAGSTGGGLTIFTYLMTRFTTPDEVLGPVSVQGLKHDEYRRLTAARLPEAEIAFLDEIWKASSSILNALLTIMHERAFDNGGRRVAVPLLSLFGASNELPQGEDLAAAWDRFALRVPVEYTSDGGFAQLLAVAAGRRQAQLVALAARLSPTSGVSSPPAPPAAPPALATADLVLLQAAVAALPLPGSLTGALAQLRRDLHAKGILVSDRRLGWAPDLLTAHALLEGRLAAEEDDLIIVRRVTRQ